MAFLALGRRSAVGVAHRAALAHALRRFGAQQSTTESKTDKWAWVEKSFLLASTVPVVAIMGYTIHAWQAVEAQRAVAEAQRQADIAYKASDEYKMKMAVEQALRPYSPPPNANSANLVRRPVMDRIRNRIKAWDEERLSETPPTPATTIICGLFESGKSCAVGHALKDVQGVVSVSVRNEKWETELMSKLGARDVAGLVKALTMVRDHIPEANLCASPIILLDIPRDTTVDVRTISTFGKEYTSDLCLAHCVVVASSATTALGFDAGGPNRRFDLWVGDFSEEEALELLTKQGIKDPEVAKRIASSVGRNAGKLILAATQVKQGIPLEVVLNENLKKCTLDVEALLPINVKDEKGKDCDVCAEIVQDLLNASGGAVEDHRWRRRGILAKHVAMRIKDSNAHAIFYDTQSKVWAFSSPAHREAAVRELRRRRGWFGWTA